MSRFRRPSSAALLGLLLLLWGPCPGLWAETFRGAVTGAETEAETEGEACSCCRTEPVRPEPSDAPAEPQAPLDDGCPFCGHLGGRAEVQLADVVPQPPPPAVLDAAPEVDAVVLTPSSRTPDGRPHRPPRDGPLGAIVLRL